MRIWMVEPETMCRKHLLGEHLELHMFIGTMRKGRSLNGFLQNNLCEPLSIVKRHDLLVNEMERRGYAHKSPLCETELQSLLKSYGDTIQIDKVVDVASSRVDLHNRCNECAK